MARDKDGRARNMELMEEITEKSIELIRLHKARNMILDGIDGETTTAVSILGCRQPGQEGYVFVTDDIEKAERMAALCIEDSDENIAHTSDHSFDEMERDYELEDKIQEQRRKMKDQE